MNMYSALYVFINLLIYLQSNVCMCEHIIVLQHFESLIIN